MRAGIGIYGSARRRLGEFLDQWLVDYAKPSVQSSTLERYEQFIRVHLKPRLGHIPLARLTPQIIQSCYRSLVERGLSSTTAHHIAALLREALDYAVKWGIVAQNPAELVEMPKRARAELCLWTPEEALRFLEEVRRTSPYYLLYAMAMLTGLRAGELLRLRWNDIDLANGILRVASGKTVNARRAVLLPDQLVAELRRHRGLGLVFCTAKGTPLNLNNIRYRDFRPLIERAGLPRIRFHDLRHFHASYLLANGVDLASLSGRMGHGSKAFTVQTYGHILAGGQELAAKVAGGLLVANSKGFATANEYELDHQTPRPTRASDGGP